MKAPNEYPELFTANTFNGIKLLSDDKYKFLVADSLRFLAEDMRIIIYAFGITPAQIKLAWYLNGGIERKDLQRDFLKFLAQKIQSDLKQTQPDYIELFKVNARDRKYQFWEKKSLSIPSLSLNDVANHIIHIHERPVNLGLCQTSIDYFFSSARFYEAHLDSWGFLTRFNLKQ